MLVGRDGVLQQFADVLDRLPGGGQAVLLRGDPGIGKSAVLDCVREAAQARGVRVRTAVGVPSESRVPYAGLQRLLLPFLDGLAGLPRAQAQALAAAVGLVEQGEGPSVLRVALGSLELLSDAAAGSPVLLLVEDAHWLDRDSCEVLAFLARRIEHEPIGLLCALRTGHPSAWDASGLAELRLPPLGDEDSGRLLDRHAPTLDPDVRRTVLRVAAGNPLALLELPQAYQAQAPAAATASAVPVPRALQDAFLERAAGLPAAAWTTLVVAALDERGHLDALLAAAGAVLGEPLSAADLEAAAATGLIELDEGTIAFRHPLARAALLHRALPHQRRAASAALADVHAGDPDRRAWFRAGACAGPDAEVAGDLLAAAARALGRGAPAAAAAAFERAAELTADPAARAGLLLRAADTQFSLGRADLALPLLGQAAPLEMGGPDRAWLTLLLEAADERTWSDPDRVALFAGIASSMVGSWEPERAVRGLLTVAHGCWHAHPGQGTLDLVVAAAGRAMLPDDSPALLAVLGCTDPVGQARTVLRGLRRVPPLPGADPLGMHLAGTAATAVWAFDVAMPYLGHAAEGLRAQGRLGLLGQALLSHAWSALHTGSVDVARRSAEEARRLTRDSGQRAWALSAELVLATVAGEQGDVDTAGRLSQLAEAELIGMGGHPLLSEVAFARGRTAVAHQQYSTAFDQLRRLFDPADVAHQPHVASWACADYVEAAAGVGRRAVAVRAFQQLEDLAAATDGPLLRAQVAYARPLLAPTEDAGDLFEEALDGALSAWPCYRTRAHLAYGQWLRRQRPVRESRSPLRAAREAADALGLVGLGRLARQELRATGEVSAPRRPDSWEALTPQEEQIVELVAGGLSNKEIGQRLFLSHRTVASHLYRVFPKLGVASRAELALAWSRRPSRADV